MSQVENILSIARDLQWLNNMMAKLLLSSLCIKTTNCAAILKDHFKRRNSLRRIVTPKETNGPRGHL